MTDKLRKPEIQSRTNARIGAGDCAQPDDFARLMGNHAGPDYFAGRRQIRGAARQGPADSS
ncbi:MAG: hypothetical protein ACKVKF_18030, partial [Rhodobacterales bacterium]